MKKRLNELENPINENTLQTPVVVAGRRKHRRRSKEIPAMQEKLDAPNIDKSHIKQPMHENHTTNIVREVIHEKLKEANYQQRERKIRSNNIIIHGLREKQAPMMRNS